MPYARWGPCDAFTHYSSRVTRHASLVTRCSSLVAHCSSILANFLLSSSLMLPTIEWHDDAVVMIDQRKLPGTELYVRCRSAQEVARAIKTMVIRGAPAIGVAAAMGLALGVRKSKATGTQRLAAEFYKMCELMAATRPTAVNLFWAIDRMKKAFAAGATAGESVDQIRNRLENEARRIHDEDVASCRTMGS